MNLTNAIKQLFKPADFRNTSYSNEEYHIKLKSGKQLWDYIDIRHLKQIKRLTINGQLSGTDIAIIQKMEQLEYLDIQQAHIISSKTSHHFIHKNHIGPYVFQNNQTLKTILLPNTVTDIEDYAFDGCINLTAIQLPKNLTYIGIKAFSHTNIQKISIPCSVTVIDNEAFTDCKNLQTVRFEDGNGTMQWTGLGFGGCPINQLYIGRDLSDDYFCEFQDPSTLKKVTLGKYVHILNINLGENLQELCMLNPTPPAVNTVIPPQCIIKVPALYYKNYWIHPIWGGKKLQSIEE